MNKAILLVILILNSALGIAQQAEFKFKDKVIRHGKILEGDEVKLSFSFENVGDAPLIIQSYEVACTCTKVSYPEAPIAPGQSGEILVDFDSNGKIGYQDRSIMITSNAKDSPAKIRFTLNVKKD